MPMTNGVRTIGSPLPDNFLGEFFGPLLKGIEHTTGEAGFHLLVSTTPGPGAVSDFLAALSRVVGGLLAFAGSLGHEGLVFCQGSGLPTVLIHQMPPPSLDLPCVTVENRRVLCAVFDLIEVHHRRRIAFLRGRDDQEDSPGVRWGYREALEAHGIPFGAPWSCGVISINAWPRRRSGACWGQEHGPMWMRSLPATR